MNAFRARSANDEGWTFIEATLAVVIMAIMVLGLTIVLLAFREQLDRSWAVRAMDQYGNDVIENLTHDLRNAVDVDVRPGAGRTSRIDIKYLDPIRHTLLLNCSYRADTRNARITRTAPDQIQLDPGFPPPRLGRGEYYQIVQFTMSKYGESTPNNWEHQDSYGRDSKFIDASWDIRFKIRYTRQAIDPGDNNWSVEKEYFNRVYMRNKNLVVQKGITD